MFYKKLLKLRQQKRAEKRNKIIFISLITGFFSAFTTVFFSKKENRQKFAKKASELKKTTGDKINEISKVISSEGHDLEKTIEEKADMVKKNTASFISRFRKTTPVEKTENQKTTPKRASRQRSRRSTPPAKTV